MAALPEASPPIGGGHKDAAAQGVDVPLLLREPDAALLPLLRLLGGPWASAMLHELSVCAMSGAMSELRRRRGGGTL